MSFGTIMFLITKHKAAWLSVVMALLYVTVLYTSYSYTVLNIESAEEIEYFLTLFTNGLMLTITFVLWLLFCFFVSKNIREKIKV
jgi:hypothetical protein